MHSKPLSHADLLLQQRTLPSQPRVVALLANELRKPAPNMRSLVQLFSMDPVLAARLLEAANAPMFAGGEAPRSIAQALMVLTPAQIQQQIQQVVPGASPKALQGWSVAKWADYCQSVAKIARALAASIQCNSSAAYTLGLLHGLGELLIHSADPHSAARLAELMEPINPGRALLEMKLLGYCSATVVSSLARQWQLPDAMCASFQYMHVPLRQPVFDPLTGVLHLALWRASTRTLQWSERQLAVSFPAEVGLALGMDIDIVLRQASIDWHAGGSPDVQL